MNKYVLVLCAEGEISCSFWPNLKKAQKAMHDQLKAEMEDYGVCADDMDELESVYDEEGEYDPCTGEYGIYEDTAYCYLDTNHDWKIVKIPQE